MSRLRLSALCFGIGLALTPALTFAKSPRTVSVVVDPVKTVASAETRPILGQVVPLRSGPIATDVAGIVQSVHVRVGDVIKANDIIAELDPVPLQLKADIAQAEASLRTSEMQQARATERTEHHKLERLEKLKASAAFTKSRYEDQHDATDYAKAAAQAAAAQRNVALANQKLAVRNLDRAVIRSPYDAVVLERAVSAGAYVKVGDGIVTLLDRGAIELEAEVPADYLGHSHVIGLEVAARISTTHSQTAHIRAVLPRENPRTRTRTVRFSLGKLQQHVPLAVNRVVTIDFPTGSSKPYLTVAKDAVIQRNGSPVVMVATDKGAQARPVSLGATIGNRFVVNAGLKAGDLAVIRGNERLQDGAALSYTVAP